MRAKYRQDDELDYESSGKPRQGPKYNATPHRDSNKIFCSVLRVPSFRIDNSFYAGRH